MLPADVLQAGAEASSHIQHGLTAGLVAAVLCHAVSTAGRQQQGLLVGPAPAPPLALPLLLHTDMHFHVRDRYSAICHAIYACGLLPPLLLHTDKHFHVRDAVPSALPSMLVLWLYFCVCPGSSSPVACRQACRVRDRYSAFCHAMYACGQLPPLLHTDKHTCARDRPSVDLCPVPLCWCSCSGSSLPVAYRHTASRQTSTAC